MQPSELLAKSFHDAEVNFRLSGFDPENNEHYQETKARVLAGEIDLSQAIDLAVEYHTRINKDRYVATGRSTQAINVNEDPYRYPGTDVLRNKMDIRDGRALEDAETEIGIYSNARLIQQQ